MGSGHVFVVLGAHHKGVDSNEWLPLQCKVCMNIKDVYSDKNEIIHFSHVKIGFVLTSTI